MGQMGIMNFCKISFDFRVGSGRFRFGSFLNDRLKWSVRVVSAMPKVGASLLTIPRCPGMAAGAVSLRKSHDIVILSFCNIHS